MFDYQLPDGWQWVTVEEVQSSEKRSTITGPFGSSIGTRFFVNEGVPVIRGNNLKIGVEKFVDDGFVFITEEKAEELKGYKAYPGDILFTAAGTIGQVGIIPDDCKFEYYIISNKQMRARFDPERVDPEFAYYWFSSKPMVDYIKVLNTGSTIPLINLGVLRKLPMPLPPLDEQKRIKKYLIDLDNKIQLNRQTNQTLEQIAQAIFKSWFVDFDPVKAKIAAKQNGQDPELASICAISGKTEEQLNALGEDALQQLKATAALFPDAMVESELGEVPEGWKYGTLSDLGTFGNERIDVSKLTAENYISTENMLEGKSGITAASSLPSVKTVPAFKYGQILISNIRPYFMKIWLAQFEGGRSNDVLGIEAIDSEGIEFLYNLLFQDVFFNFMMTTSKGAKMPRGDKVAIMGWDVVIPEKEIQRAYSRAVRSYYKIINSRNNENQVLVALRNTLLPKLLSGELSLDNPQNRREAVA